MDAFELARKIMQKTKLFVLYWRRIVFVGNHFDVSLWTKLKANVCGGFLADQWELYDLDMKKKKEYLSEFDWYRSRYINYPFDEMLNNKIVSTEVMKQYIRMPEIYLVNSKGTISDLSGNILSPEKAVEVIAEKKNVIIKPFKKGKGTDVHRISFEGDAVTIDGREADEQELIRFLKEREDWYISEAVAQHPYAEALFDKSVNTIRIITLRSPENGKMKIFFAVQRIGTEKTIPVDNASRGGIVCRIDLDTGRLSYGRSLHDKKVYTEHPDLGARLEGACVPGWEDLKREILELSNRFPYLDFVAWDVAILPDGTNCVIEANTSSGVNIIQLWGGQRQGELGDFYRHHRVIRDK